MVGGDSISIFKKTPREGEGCLINRGWALTHGNYTVCMYMYFLINKDSARNWKWSNKKLLTLGQTVDTKPAVFLLVCQSQNPALNSSAIVATNH